jgi:hypothetical protein
MKRLFAILFFISSLAADFHVCTVCNKTEEEYFSRLKNSCSALNLDLKILGQGMPYVFNLTKLTRMEEFLENIPDDDIILFTDAFDVFYVGGRKGNFR